MNNNNNNNNYYYYEEEIRQFHILSKKYKKEVNKWGAFKAIKNNDLKLMGSNILHNNNKNLPYKYQTEEKSLITEPFTM